MLRDSRTSMQYCTSPLRWNKPQTKSWSMFQFRSMTEVTRFTIPGRGVDLPKELISGAFHRMFGAQDVPDMDILSINYAIRSSKFGCGSFRRSRHYKPKF